MLVAGAVGYYLLVVLDVIAEYVDMSTLGVSVTYNRCTCHDEEPPPTCIAAMATGTTTLRDRRALH